MKVPQGASRRKAQYTCRLAEFFDAGLATAWKAKLSRTAAVVNPKGRQPATLRSPPLPARSARAFLPFGA
jgi:hypothetical protein